MELALRSGHARRFRSVEYRAAFCALAGGIALRVADVDAARAELRVEGRRVRRRHDRHGRVQAGVVQGSRRERPDASPEVRRMIGVERVDFIGVRVRDLAEADAILRGHARPLRAQPGLDRTLGRVRGAERDARARPKGVHGREARAPAVCVRRGPGRRRRPGAQAARGSRRRVRGRRFRFRCLQRGRRSSRSTAMG